MSKSSNPQPDAYPNTRLSLLTRASADDEAVALKALDDLVKIYQRPVFLSVLARGYHHEDAEDHTQAFLSAFIHSGSFKRFNPEQGRLRCYLAGALSNFLNKAYRKEQRTPPQTQLEDWTASDPNSPDEEFDRLCAREMLANAIRKLEQENSGDEAKKHWFSTMRMLIPVNPESGLIKQAAATLVRSEENIRTDTYRLRKRLRKLFENEVRETVRPEDFQSELAYLIDILQNPPGNHGH